MKTLTDNKKLDRLQKEFTLLKEARGTEISKLKKERRALKAKVANLENKLSSVNIYTPEMKQIEDDNKKILADMERIQEDNRNLFNRNCALDILISEVKENPSMSVDYYPFDNSMSDFEPESRKMELHYFHAGFATNEYGRLFFNKKTLIIEINPLSGTHICESHQKVIIKKIINHPNYQEALKKWEPYKDIPFKPISEESELLNELGRQLLPLYIDYFISYYTWNY